MTIYRSNLAALIVVVALSIHTPKVDAAGYVLCRSMMDSSVTAVFKDRCPQGWYFVKWV